MSFESPNTPGVLNPTNIPPEMDMNIMLDVQKLESEEYDSFYEVVMNINVSAKREEKTTNKPELKPEVKTESVLFILALFGENTHNVPEDWFATHGNHGLWPKLSFFSKACTQSTSQ